ncbi:MAG: macro domain-containing protein [Tissierellia bacterium]|nr:macro domain-containing protein [Tissierellia bacterium]
MYLKIIKGDISQMRTQAIVNAANRDLRQGSGVCGAIFRGAGPRDMEEACQALRPIETGQAVLTPGFKLAADYVIHTAGPIYRDGQHGEEALLRAAYENSMALAKKEGIGSIAFPLISSGIYGYPQEEALRVAIKTLDKAAQDLKIETYLVLFDQALLEAAQAMASLLDGEN